MQRLSIVAFATMLASTWVAFPVYSAAPVIDLSNGGFSSRPRVTNKAPVPKTVDGRLSRLERLLENQPIVDLTLRMESMQQEMQRMFGELEVITHDLKTLKRRQRELYLDIDRRFQKFESSAASGDGGASGGNLSGNGQSGSSANANLNVPADVGDAGLGQPSASIVGNSENTSVGDAGDTPPSQQSDAQVHKTLYQAAFNLLREGKYDLAKLQFDGYIAKYPNSDYADNAQYWLGEINYVQRRFDVAITEFNKVLLNYPDSSKFADALLKIGLSQYELEKWDLASNAFKKIIDRYPNTSEARLADKRLQRIKLQKQ